MAILTLQRRLREAGRIRIGQQVKTSNGKTRPAKLDTFRLTSADSSAIEAAAQLYGGTPQQWKDAPIGEQWEVFTTTNAIPVVIPPATTAFTQFYETWSGGGCTRRCDGERELLTDSPCLCATEDEGTCKPTTRLSVMLQDLPGLGVWRIETHGYYAATELAGTVEVCIAAATRGQLLPAILRLEQRQVKRAGEQVRKFAVPVIDVQVTPTALGLVTTTSSPPPGAIGTWQPIQPVGELEVAEAIRDTEQPAPRAKRKNSPPELPPTGLNPRHMADLPGDSGPSAAQTRMIMALFGDLLLVGDDMREARLATISEIIGRPIASSKEVTRAEASTLIDGLQKLMGEAPDEHVDPGDDAA